MYCILENIPRESSHKQKCWVKWQTYPEFFTFPRFLMPNISLSSPKTNDQPMLLFRIYAPVSHATHILATFSGPKKPSILWTPIRLHSVMQYIRQVGNSDPVNCSNYKLMASKYTIIPFNEFTFNISQLTLTRFWGWHRRHYILSKGN